MPLPLSPFSPKRVIFVVVALVWTCLTVVQASSTPQRPLTRLAHPSVHRLDILPRPSDWHKRSHTRSIAPDLQVLQHYDSFRLILSAFNRTYHLHLRPNPDLLHSSARINYYKNGPDGQAILDRTEPLLRSHIKAYWGDVIHPDVSHDRMREDAVGGLLNSDTRALGWARIIVHHQGDIDAGVSPVFEGAFSANGVVHHVVTTENYMRTKHPLDPAPLSPSMDNTSPLVIFRDIDIMSHHEEAQFRANLGPMVLGKKFLDEFPMHDPDTPICSHDRLAWNTDPQMNSVLRQHKSQSWLEMFGFHPDLPSLGDNVSTLSKRDDVAGNSMNSNFADHIGQSTGCPIQQMIVYMGVAADCKYVQQYGSTQNATSAILNDWNMASLLYKTTFNVSLAILQIEIHDATCPSPPDPTRPWNVDCGSLTLNDRLSGFSQWRGAKGEDGTGLWHLMSGCPTGTEVGVAWLGSLCQSTASGSPGNIVSGTAVTAAGRAEWQVVAHEIGHTFGAIHDCTTGCNSSSPCCPLTTGQCDSGSQFIMSPTASQAEARFSQCSLGNICSLMQSPMMNTSCVQIPDPKKQTLSLQMCGNGIVETGEDCDPGKGSNSTCCDPATCKFTLGSQCDPASSPCCTSGCVFAPTTQVCRPSQDPICDIPESCTGTSASCPWDRTQPDGKSCGDGLSCASGKCTSPSAQCQTIGAAMGLTTACANKGDTSCQVSCQDPQDTRECVVLQATLIDGSPCGYGGKCATGKCQPGSFFDMAKDWFVNNMQISIPVTVVAGLIVLFILYGFIRCIFRCCRNDRIVKSAEPALRGIPPQRLISRENIGAPMTAAEPGVWIPPRQGSLRNNQSYRVHRNEIPAVLQAGTAASQRNAPSVVASRRAASRAQDGRVPGLPTRPSDSRGDSQAHWVDPAAWNGPRR